MRQIVRLVSTMSLALGSLILAAPSQAVTIYPPSGEMTWTNAANGSIIVPPGGFTNFATGLGTFLPGESVGFTLTGENAAGATLASIRARIDTNVPLGSGTAAQNGSISGSVKLPNDAIGTYTLTLTGSTRALSAQVVVTPEPNTDSSGSLSVTGVNSNALALSLWGGAGLVAAGGATFALAASRKRQRSKMSE